MKSRTTCLSAMLCLFASMSAQAGPTEGGLPSFSDGLPDVLDAMNEIIGAEGDAVDGLRNWGSLDEAEAACGSAYTDASGPTVPSQCAENQECEQCYTEAVRKIDFNRFYIERARCITDTNVKMAKSAMAFGDSASGVHAITGMSWKMQGKPQIEQAVDKLKQTYRTKAGQYLGGLEGSLKQLGECEAEFYGEDDWYQRYGWIYHNFMKAKYESAPE